MKRKIVIAVFSLLVIIAMVYLYSKFAQKKKFVANIQVLDNIAIKTINGDSLNIDGICDYEKYILCVFSPSCDICINEAIELSANRDLLTNCCFVFISSHPMDEIKQFAKNTNLNSLDNFIIGYCQGEITHDHFQAYSIPKMFLYNRDKKLIAYRNYFNLDEILEK